VAERWYEKTKWPMMSVLSTTLHWTLKTGVFLEVGSRWLRNLKRTLYSKLLKLTLSGALMM
jgi:hypothetical protein